MKIEFLASIVFFLSFIYVLENCLNAFVVSISYFALVSTLCNFCSHLKFLGIFQGVKLAFSSSFEDACICYL